MSDLNDDKFMEQERKIEFGYFAKRKKMFDAKLEKAFKAITKQPTDKPDEKNKV